MALRECRNKNLAVLRANCDFRAASQASLAAFRSPWAHAPAPQTSLFRFVESLLACMQRTLRRFTPARFLTNCLPPAPADGEMQEAPAGHPILPVQAAFPSRSSSSEGGRVPDRGVSILRAHARHVSPAGMRRRCPPRPSPGPAPTFPVVLGWGNEKRESRKELPLKKIGGGLLFHKHVQYHRR